MRLRRRNAAPFAGFLDGGWFSLCSASPERFLMARNQRVETRPIKGTRGRAASPEADLFAGDDLKQSEKDRAYGFFSILKAMGEANAEELKYLGETKPSRPKAIRRAPSNSLTRRSRPWRRRPVLTQELSQALWSIWRSCTSSKGAWMRPASCLSGRYASGNRC